MDTDIKMLQTLESSRELNKSMETSDSSNEESNDCDGVFLRSIRQEVSENYEEETNLSEIFYLQSDFTVEPSIIRTEINHNVQNSSTPKVNAIKTDPNQTDTNLKKFYEEFNENEFVEFYEQDQQMTDASESSSQNPEPNSTESVSQPASSQQNNMSNIMETSTPVKKLVAPAAVLDSNAHKKETNGTASVEDAMFAKTEDPSGLMIYKCNLCAYFSTTEQYVKRHVARHVSLDLETNQKLMKCLKCVFKSDCQTTMFNHWSDNHQDNKDNFGFKLHKCQYCTYKTKNTDNLKEHEASHHFPAKDVKDESSASNDGNSLTLENNSFTTDGSSFNMDGNSFNTDGNAFHIDSTDSNTFNIDENSLNTDGNIMIKDEMTIDDVLIKDEFMPNINISSVDSIDDNNSLSESFPNTVVSNETNDSEVTTAVEMVNEFGREEVIEEISPELVIKVEIVKDATKDLDILRYKCIECSYQSVNRANLERHSVKHKNPKEIVWHHCEKCQFKTPYSRNIGRHMESVHKEKATHPSEYKYSCDQCKKRFEFFYLMKKHKISHTKPTVYRCKSCVFETTDKMEHLNHNATHKKENTVIKVENIVNKTDTSRLDNIINLNMAIKKEETTEENKVVEIKIADVADLTSQPKPTTIPSQKSYKCHLCSYETSLITDLTNHSLSHKTDYQQKTQPKPALIQCEHCSFVAKSRHIMLRHSIVHKTGDDVVWYYCEYCDFKTKHKNVRRTHMKRHMDRGDKKKSDSEDQAFVMQDESSSDV